MKFQPDNQQTPLRTFAYLCVSKKTVYPKVSINSKLKNDKFLIIPQTNNQQPTTNNYSSDLSRTPWTIRESSSFSLIITRLGEPLIRRS